MNFYHQNPAKTGEFDEMRLEIVRQGDQHDMGKGLTTLCFNMGPLIYYFAALYPLACSSMLYHPCFSVFFLGFSAYLYLCRLLELFHS